jgi:hypothetical protein
MRPPVGLENGAELDQATALFWVRQRSLTIEENTLLSFLGPYTSTGSDFYYEILSGSTTNCKMLYRSSTGELICTYKDTQS